MCQAKHTNKNADHSDAVAVTAADVVAAVVAAADVVAAAMAVEETDVAAAATEIGKGRTSS